MTPMFQTLIETVNTCGKGFHAFAQGMFVQVTVLVGLLLALDLLLRRYRRVSSCLRYGLWLLVLVKLVLPPSLAFPTGIGYWIRHEAPAVAPAPARMPDWYATGLSDFNTRPVHLEAGPIGTSAPVARSTERPGVSLEWQGVFLLLWLAIVAWFLAQLVHRYRDMRCKIDRAQPAPDWLLARMAECRTLLGVRRPVGIKLSRDVPGPVICGFRRPVLLLPAFLPDRLSPLEVQAVLGHELVHVRRRDTWVNLAQSLLQIVYFYHPLVWVANRITARVRELAVDETVLATLKIKAGQYTATLIHVAEMAYRAPAPNVCFVGLAESREALKERITHMARHKHPERVRPGWVGLMVIVAVGAVLVPMGQGRWVHGGQTDPGVQVPALPVGIAEFFALDANGVLETFGEPKNIFYRDQEYTLDNLPEQYFLVYEDLSFAIDRGKVGGITLLDPRHVFGNGMRVGNTEQEIIAALGEDYTIREFEIKDFLQYDRLGLMVEIYKPERIAREINIDTDYGNPDRLSAYDNAVEFTRLLPQRIAQLNIDKANRQQVIALFGEPVKYIWGKETFSAESLPKRFIALYPNGFRVFMADDRIVELRFEDGDSGYEFKGLHVGSTLEEALAVLGEPVEVVTGKGNAFADGVLYTDIDGRLGHCYYHRSDQRVRLWFMNYKVGAIYLTRSDYGKKDSYDEAFGAQLPGRVAQLDIDNADRQALEALFGPPLGYIWGENTFTADELPENYILNYPCDFSVWMKGDKIMEIRHWRDSRYVYAPGVQIGASVEEVVAALGDPAETVVGQENTFRDQVLYRDLAGEKGHGYYHRSDQGIRVWFMDDRVIAIYMTRGDFPVH